MRRLYIYLLSIATTLLIVGAGAAVIPLFRPQRVADNEHLNTLRHLVEMSDTKYENNLYATRYADIATQEKRPTVASLLMAIARAEAIQCENCGRAIKVLGGDENPRTPPRIVPHTTRHHLSTLIEQKIRFHHTKTSLFVRHAACRSDIYIARLMTWCDASDIRQIEFLRRELSRLDSLSQPSPCKYYVCPRCSNISDDEFISHFCPYCMTPFSDFYIFDSAHKKSPPDFAVRQTSFQQGL